MNLTLNHPVVKSFLTEQEIEPNEICETGTHSSGGGFEHFGILTDDGHVYTFNIADRWIELSYNTWNSLDDYFNNDDEKGFGCEINFPDYDEGRRWDFKVVKPQIDIDADEYMLMESALIFFEKNISDWYKEIGHPNPFRKILSKKTRKESKMLRDKLSKYANQMSDYVSMNYQNKQERKEQ